MSAMGVARDASARAFRLVLAWFVRQLWCRIRLNEKDAELVMAWLRGQPDVHASSELALYSKPRIQGTGRIYEYEPEIQVTTRLRCSAKGRPKQWIWITRRESNSTDAVGERRLRNAVVSFFGRDKGILEAILQAGHEIKRQQREKYLTVVQVYDFGKDHGLNWLHPQDKDKKQPGRSISSVVLPRCPITGLDQAEALLEDAREFLASEQWYTERGIPYRRGYLLHGIPGGGKSSLVMAVASELHLPIYMLQLSSEHMGDDTLNTLLQHGMQDPPSILLLEDVDLLHSAVLHRRSAGGDKELADQREDLEKSRGGRAQDHIERRRRGRLTLSGLLNALDGPTATDSRLLFMTTNARDRLDPALLRSGRIDYEVEFKEADKDQIQRLFTRFYSDYRSSKVGRQMPDKSSSSATGLVEAVGTDATEAPKEQLASRSHTSPSSTIDLASEFAQQVADSGARLTTADIQRHLMQRKTDPVRALKELPVLLRSLGSSCPVISSESEEKDTVRASDQKPTCSNGNESVISLGNAEDSATSPEAWLRTHEAENIMKEEEEPEREKEEEGDCRASGGAE